jgi:hypothetical protein
MSYTAEQRAQLDKMIVQTVDGFDVARAEFMNHTLNRDGSVTPNVDALRAEWQDKVTAALAGGTDAAALENATNFARKVAEIDGHIAQKRFLFIPVDAVGDIVYYQCAVPGNPDVRMS